MSESPPPAFSVRINGARNAVAPFPTQIVALKIGGMTATPPMMEPTVPLTLESPGGHADDGVVDVEIAIPIGQLEQVIAVMRSCASALARDR